MAATRLEHVSDDTPLTDALQLIILFGGLAALLLATAAAVAARSREGARVTATIILIGVWPLFCVLIAVTHTLMF